MKSSQRLATATLACALIAAQAAHAEAQRAALFAFELDDTSLQGAMQGQGEADLARLGRLDTQLRDLLARSGQYAPLPVAADATMPTLRTCDGCDVDLARKLGAQLSVIGWVQKVSNLILNINVVVRDVATGQRVAAGSVDIRGDTDESWTRGLSYLVRNRILSTRTAK